MFTVKEIDAAQADASEMNCSADECGFWIPPDWCGGNPGPTYEHMLED